MYARTNKLTADTSKIDDGIRFVREQVMPAVRQIDGCVGLSLLVDRESGRCIVTTAWRDEDAMTASADRVRDMRRRAGEVFGAEPTVTEWEVAVMHTARPPGESACTRVIWGRVDPGALDRALDTLRSAVVPRLEDIPGFCGMSTVVDRQSGRMATTATYESRAAMEASRERGAALRQEFSQAVGVEITEVAEFELVFVELWLPEQAVTAQV